MDNINEEINEGDIAVIGMSGRFPGAKNIDEFWQNLKDGVESIRFFSEQELIDAGIEPSIVKETNYVKAKGILDNVAEFDAAFFGLSPKEAEITDPQQRLFLECAWEALENAGYDPQTYSGAIGLYGGMSGIDTYLSQNLSLNPTVNTDKFQLLIGNDKDFLCTRIAYKMNLTGPSITVQTACSTALVAVAMAYKSLLTYQCDMVLAGGVAISLPVKSGYFYQEGMILSPDGHCRAFDAKAQGTVQGNGVGLVVLKRLEEAIADKDHIYAVIRGTAINNDGNLKVGYTAPSVQGQVQVIAEALAMAETPVKTIGYIETHGTGTVLGDPIEIAALTQVFQAKTDKKNYCAIGSVKTNIGHLDTAAGIAGFIKTVLAIEHQLIPPSLHFDSPNPKLDLDNSPFYVNTTLWEWKTNGYPRRAGVSAFGIGGTNAHVILEEAPQSKIKNQKSKRSWQLLLLSAKTDTALETATIQLVEHFKQYPNLNLADVAYTYQVGRHAFNHRRMLVCQTLAEAINAFSAPNEVKSVLTHTIKDNENPSVVFMFSGQGAQYVNMGLELYQTEPLFRQQVDRCTEYLKSHLELDLRTVLYPKEAQQTEQANQQLKQTAFTQPAIFVIEYALAQLWMAYGIQPKAMIGHSIGEYVAACLAGVFTLEDALMLVAVRGQLMQSVEPGAMLAVPLSEAAIQPLLNQTIDLAAINRSTQCVVSGTDEAITQFATQLAEQGIECQRLQTSHAFHSEMMSPILTLFLEQVQRIQLKAPQIPFISNVTGTWINNSEAMDPNYWVNHIRQTVRFAAGLGKIFEQFDKPDILLEIGPGRTLSTLAKQHPDNVGQLVLTSLRHPKETQSDSAFLLTSLGQLWLTGITVNWAEFHSHEPRYRLPLPTYPFERQRYWIEATFKKFQYQELKRGHNLDVKQQSTLAESTQNSHQKFSQHHSRPNLSSVYIAPRNLLEKTLAELWQNFLSITQVGINDDFFELGGDSLIAVQLVTKLRQTLSVELSSHSLLNTPTIATLAESIQQVSSHAELIQQPKPVLPSSLVEIQAGHPLKIPLFLVPPAGGHVYIYRDLARCLGPEQPVYGLQAVDFDHKNEDFNQINEDFNQIEEKASYFIKALLVRQPDGPYILGGFSFGGIVAFEMAQQLLALGHELRLLVMIDTPRPGTPTNTIDDTDILTLLAGIDNKSPSLVELRKQNFDEQLTYFLEYGKETQKLFPDTTKEQLRQLFQLFKADIQAIWCYKPQIYQRKIIFFRATERDEFINPPNPEHGWLNFTTKGIKVYDIPGNHFTMNESPNVEVMANLLIEYSQKA